MKVVHIPPPDTPEETELKHRLAEIKRRYQDEINPIVERLSAISNTKRFRIVVMPEDAR